MLYHVSEEPGLSRFEPRAHPNYPEPVVWAIHAARLHNYLLPRDCPRVTFYAGPNTTEADVKKFLGSSPAVVAFESRWLDRVRTTRLYLYELPADSFACVDECAGYYHSPSAVTASAAREVDDPLRELASCGVEVRIVPSLWELHDAVLQSTLAFSIIRMRNAMPRPASSPSGRGLT